MSGEENSPINASTGQKRPGALQLGPRKKPYAISPIEICLRNWCKLCVSAAAQILLCTMVGILDAPFMPYALLALS